MTNAMVIKFCEQWYVLLCTEDGHISHLGANNTFEAANEQLKSYQQRGVA